MGRCAMSQLRECVERQKWRAMLSTHSAVARTDRRLATQAMSASAALISGTAIAAAITDELTAEVATLRGNDGGDSAPGLAVVLVGDRKDSATYVRNKKKACEKIGIRSIGHDLPADVSEAELLALIRALNADPLVHGILVQVRA